MSILRLETQCPSSSRNTFLIIIGACRTCQVHSATGWAKHSIFVCVFVCFVFYFSCGDVSYHGRHHPADVYGAASVQIVLSSVLLVLGADLEQIQAGLQNARLVLNTR